MDGVAVIEAVAKKRGCLLKGRGGELDLEKAAAILLNDYRSRRAGPDQYGNADPAEGQQLAAGHDAGFFPFRLQADVDDRHAALAQLVELGVVDVDDFGLGETGGGKQAGK
jgi:hypothetical protein